jgi:hypothetical protein
MPILQQQPPETEATRQIIGSSLDPPRDLEYPHAPISAKSDKAANPLVFWSLSLVAGLLILLLHGPIKAPQFEELTQYVCDPLPLLQGQPFRDQVVFQRGFPTYDFTPAWTPCRRSGGLIRIWRVARPSPYGPYVFHATCNEHVITYYRNRVEAYESGQLFGIVFASAMMLVSAIGLAVTVTRRVRAIPIPGA